MLVENIRAVLDGPVSGDGDRQGHASPADPSDESGAVVTASPEADGRITVPSKPADEGTEGFEDFDEFEETPANRFLTL